MTAATNESMSVIVAVADAIRHYRYRGASNVAIDAYARARGVKITTKSLKESLAQLQSDGYTEKRGDLWFLQPRAFKLAKGASYRPDFQDMDMVILAALLHGGTNCDIMKLLGLIDFFDRVLPSFDDLYGGLNRLASARLIIRKRDLFLPTPFASELFELAISKAKRTFHDQLLAFTRLALCPCCGVAIKRVTWRIPLTEEEYDHAVEAYRRTMRPIVGEQPGATGGE